ncbi:NADPH oxidase B [Wallemia mellicola]|nr:NADPH oxidase B [Wallemia mellicola]
MSIEYPTTAHLRHRKVNSLNKVQDGQTLSYKDLHNQQKHLTIINRLRIFLLNDGLSYLFIAVWVLISSLVFGLGFVHYDLNDDAHLSGRGDAHIIQARTIFGKSFVSAKSAALCLHINIAFILFPVCRTLVSFARSTPLGQVIPFDKNIDFHKIVGYAICFFTVIHVLSHQSNFARLAIHNGTGFKGFFFSNFASGPGATGWIMLLCLMTMLYFARQKKLRRANVGYERFWYSHHLFIPFFILWQSHGMFCMIQPDSPPYCNYNVVGVFWKYWIAGGVIYIGERLLREYRARKLTYISKVIQHPSKVIELQIRKEGIRTQAGQYIFLNCPAISLWQWHPFTLTSAPEEDYISVHIRIAGDFTKALAAKLGCDLDQEDKVIEGDDPNGVNAGIVNKVLPRVMIDGPFGSASEDVFNYEIAVLVGAGIGVTPFASILKDIWYRAHWPDPNKPTRLSKVYFIWVIRDFGSAEWFHSLLHAIEEQDLDNYIEIQTYLTAKIKVDDIQNILAHDIGSERDAISGLRAPTNFGRPNWDRIFQGITAKHPNTDAGVFFCGPQALGSALHKCCNKYSNPKGTRFFFGKENF